MKNAPILFIVGPTGSGKSKLALELAKRWPSEIVSADSMQVYKGMDIGTAKASVVERKQIPHHLIDILEPSEEFSVYDYCRRAFQAICDIRARGKRPIVVGGTGLYIRSLINGLSFTSGRNETLRKMLEDEIQSHGLNCLYQKLAQEMPEQASKIKPSDKKRIIRAFELRKNESTVVNDSWSGLSKLGYAYQMIGILVERLALYQQINSRVDEMIKAGLLEEVKSLYEKPLSQSSSQAIGYKELKLHLDHQLSLDAAVQLIKKNSRNYAKRQMTWFRRDREIVWFKRSLGNDPFESYKSIVSYLEAQGVL